MKLKVKLVARKGCEWEASDYSIHFFMSSYFLLDRELRPRKLPHRLYIESSSGSESGLESKGDGTTHKTRRSLRLIGSRSEITIGAKQREKVKKLKMSKEIVQKGENPPKQSQVPVSITPKKPDPPKQSETPSTSQNESEIANKKDNQAPMTEEERLLSYRITILKIFLEFIKKTTEICTTWGEKAGIVMEDVMKYFDREISPRLKKETRNDEDYTTVAREFTCTAVHLSTHFRFDCKVCDNKSVHYCFFSLPTSFANMLDNAFKGDPKFRTMASLEFRKVFPEKEKISSIPEIPNPKPVTVKPKDTAPMPAKSPR
jgi:hypothetical protein